MRRSNRTNWQRGQALLEFAIFGSLALLALAFLIQVGLQVNYQQEIDQAAFRTALAKADSYSVVEPAAVQHLEFRDRQMPSPADGFAVMPRVLTSSGATVVWGTFLARTDRDDRQSDPLTVVRVNATQREFRKRDFDGTPEDDPLFSRITRSATSAGSVRQTDATSSRLSTTTNQTTTVVLKNNDTVSSTISSNVNWNW